LTAVVVHPDLEIETSKARALLGTDVPLKAAIQQWANGALVHGLHRGDFELIARSLEDSTPSCARRCPRPRGDQGAAADAGAGQPAAQDRRCLHCAEGVDAAARVAGATTWAVEIEIGGRPQTYVSAVGASGARVVPS
jgi:homoserine kinase